MAGSRKMQNTRPDGLPELRIWHKKAQQRGRKTIGARYLVKCGCCNEKVEIFYDEDSLEINGVDGSIQNWREVLLPLLNIQSHKIDRASATSTPVIDCTSQAGEVGSLPL